MPRSNKLVFLGVITLAAVIAAVVTTRNHAPTTSTRNQYAFPGLKDRINELARLEVSGTGGALTIRHKGKGWFIEQADNYPASFSKVREAAIAVAEAKIIAQKTSNPAYYSRLGVEDPGAKKSTSKLLTLFDAKGGKLASLIIGKRRMSSAAAGSQGYYIRKPGGTHALLVEGNLDIDTKPVHWFDPVIINIKPKHISEVIIQHPGQKPIQLSRATAKGNFVLADIPKGKELQSSYILDRTEDILDDVSVEDVRSADKLKFPEQATVATVKTYDGLTTVITSAVVDGSDWSRFRFEYKAPPAPAEQASTPAGKTTAKAGETAAAASGKSAGPAEKAPQKNKDELNQKLADQLNKETSGWVYKVPSYKYNQFARKLDDMIKDKVPEKKDEKKAK